MFLRESITDDDLIHFSRGPSEELDKAMDRMCEIERTIVELFLSFES